MAKHASQRVLRPSERRRRSSRYVAALDGLRAFAVLAVIFYHMSLSWAPGGLMGVTVFFVISGYLINGLLVAEYDATKTISLPQFWLRRVRRIIPAVLLALAGTLVLCALVSPTLFGKARTDLIPSLFFFNNWWQIFHNVSYFEAAAAPSPLTHYWSLAIEEQFYIVWPLLLLVLLKLRMPKKGIAVIIGVLAIASFGAMAYLYSPMADPSRIYYGTDTRAGSLLIGAFLAIAWPSTIFGLRRKQSSNGAARLAFNILGVVALAALVVIIVFTNSYTSFPYLGGIALVSVLTALLIAVLVVPNTWVARLMQLRPLVWIGKRSYGMYLWHYPIILATSRFTSTIEAPWWVRVSQIIVIFALSDLSFRFVETPIRSGALRAWWQSRRSPKAEGDAQQPLRKRALSRTAARATVATCATLACAAGIALAVMPQAATTSMPGAAVQPSSSSTTNGAAQFVNSPADPTHGSSEQGDSAAGASASPSAEASSGTASSGASASDASSSGATSNTSASSVTASTSDASSGAAASAAAASSDASSAAASSKLPSTESASTKSTSSAASSSKSASTKSASSAGASSKSTAAASSASASAASSNGTTSASSKASPSASASAPSASASSASASSASSAAVATQADSTSSASGSSGAASNPSGASASSGASDSATSVASVASASAAAASESADQSSGTASDASLEPAAASADGASAESPADETDDASADAAANASGDAAEANQEAAPSTVIFDKTQEAISARVKNLSDDERAQIKELQMGLVGRLAREVGAALEEAAEQTAEQERENTYEELFETQHLNSSGALIFSPLLIGDSVAAGCENEFYRVFPYGHSDAQVNRNIWESPYDWYAENDQVGDYVVFCLGTNNAVIDEQVDEMLNNVGNDKKVLLVNVRCPRDWEAQTNQALANAQKNHDNVVALVDWYGASAGHDEYFYEDGIHVNAIGAEAYISLIQQAIIDTL